MCACKHVYVQIGNVKKICLRQSTEKNITIKWKKTLLLDLLLGDDQ